MLKGMVVVEGFKSQNGSSGESCLIESTMFSGGGFSESMSSVPKSMKISLFAFHISSTPRRSTEILAMAKARLCR